MQAPNNKTKREQEFVSDNTSNQRHKYYKEGFRALWKYLMSLILIVSVDRSMCLITDKQEQWRSKILHCKYF